MNPNVSLSNESKQKHSSRALSTDATIKFENSEFKIMGPPSLRGQPEVAFQHRLNTRAHLKYLQDEKLFDITDSRWAKATVDGEVVYGHEFEGGVLTVRLATKSGKLNLTHNEDGAFDRHLLGTPGENTVYSITSSNNGLVSTHTFAAETAGITSVAIIFAALAFTVSLANGIIAAEAAAAAGTAVATFAGVSSATIVPGIGIALAVLAFIGIWIAYSVGRDIVLNLIWENRSTKALKLVDHAVYNIGDNPLKSPIALPALQSIPPFEFYSDVVVNLDNYSKIRGIGVSLKFEKIDGTSLIVCIRNDIYKTAHYSIQTYPKGDLTSAQQAYDNCGGSLVTTDVAWGTDLVVKNRLDANSFNNYNFTGIISFHDAA
jgi:hypothetical protein